MKNKMLAQDYIQRATHRLAALDVLFGLGSWADVVRESQETVELALKSLLLACSIEVPRLHDVSPILREHRSRLPKSLIPHLDRIADISRSLRRDRELAFYGSADLTPSDFYQRRDAEKAREDARWVVTTVAGALQSRPSGKAKAKKGHKESQR